MRRYDATPQQMQIWRDLTPAQRDYDRFVGYIPAGVPAAFETDDAQRAFDERNEASMEDRGCSCHISPPCSYCVEHSDEAETSI